MPSAPRPLTGILPPGATDYERLLAGNVDRLLDLDADAIRKLWNPETCPIDDLPYLAWALSVDLWRSDWPEVKKRAVVASALTDHARKGTLGQIRRYLDYMGSRVVKATVPPAKVFGITGVSDADRQRWLESLPQIRIYPYTITGTTPQKRAFMTGPAGFRSFYRTDPGISEASAPPCFMQPSRGRDLYGDQVTFQAYGGAEVPAHIESLAPVNGVQASEVRVDFTGSKRSFYGHCFSGASIMRASRAAQGIVRVQLNGAAPAVYVAASGLSLQSVQPIRVYQVRNAPVGRFFMGRNFMGSPKARMLQSFAPRLIYDRFSLLDPNSGVPIKHGHSFMSFSRFGIKPFTAELQLEIPMNRPRWRLGVGRGSFLSGFVRGADFTALRDAREAIGASRALRDTVLIDPEIYRVVRLGDGRPLGSFKLGQYLPKQ